MMPNDKDRQHERELDRDCTSLSSGCTDAREYAASAAGRFDLQPSWGVVPVVVVLVSLLGHGLHRLGIVAVTDIRFILTIDEIQNVISRNHQFW
jgi:hypothetical protein